MVFLYFEECVLFFVLCMHEDSGINLILMLREMIYGMFFPSECLNISHVYAEGNSYICTYVFIVNDSEILVKTIDDFVNEFISKNAQTVEKIIHTGFNDEMPNNGGMHACINAE